MLQGYSRKDLDFFSLDVEIILLCIFTSCKLANPEYIYFISEKGKGTIPQKVTQTRPLMIPCMAHSGHAHGVSVGRHHLVSSVNTHT